MTISDTVLQVQDLRVRFGPVEAVRGISFNLRRGRRVGLVGESGSGKSVTALSIMRLAQGSTATGRILLDGDDLLKKRRREIERIRGARIAMIYQDPMSSLNPVQTIGRQVVEAIRAHSKIDSAAAQQRAVELLTGVGINQPAERLRSYPHQFSGGMLQRVMIAIALASSPDVLIADEPTTALDVTIQARIIDLLYRISSERGVAVLLITHDLGVAAGFCDSINVMQQGEIVEAAPIDQLYTRPAHPYTRALLESVIDLDTDVSLPIATSEALASPRAATSRGRSGERRSRRGPTVLRPEGAGSDPSVLAELVNVHKEYQLGGAKISAVDGVSLSIYRGETFGLVGESGSGKSTVARCLLGLTKLTSGTVRFDGQDIGALSNSQLRSVRSRMQVVFQDPYGALNRRHTARKLVMAPLAAHRVGTRAERAQRAERTLSLVGLEPALFDRYPSELSGGQCQRIAIARALVLEPDLVVLDESVSSLDVSLQAQVLNLLRELQQDLGLTYLFVSHDLAVVRYMCSRIAVMQAGTIVEDGGRADLFSAPQKEYTKTLLAAIPSADPVREQERRRGRLSGSKVPANDGVG